MGCGASSLKGEPIADLSASSNPPPQIHVHSPSGTAAEEEEEFLSQQRKPSKAKVAKGRAYHDTNNETFDNHDDQALLPATRDPMRNNPPSKKSVASTSGVRSSIGKGAGTIFTAVGGGGSVSARKKSSKISDEDMLKYTGMTREELNTWGDKEVYRKQDAATAGVSGVGVGFGAMGGGAFGGGGF